MIDSATTAATFDDVTHGKHTHGEASLSSSMSIAPHAIEEQML